MVYANSAALRLLGLSATELFGRTLAEAGADAFHEDGTPFRAEDLPGPMALATGKSVRNVVMGIARRDGSERAWLLAGAEPLPHPDGGVQEVVVTFVDHAGQRRAEQDLRTGLYRQLVEEAHDILYRTDARGFFTYVNPAATKITGYGASELVGKHFTELIRADHRSRVAAFLSDQFRRRIPSTYDEFVAATKNGSEIWVGQNVQVLVEGDRVLGFQAVARDITERKRAELAAESSRQAALEAGRLKSEWVAAFCDELRVPLIEIAAGLGRAGAAAPVGDSVRDVVARVDEAAELARLEAGRLDLQVVEFDLQQLVHDVAEALAGDAARAECALLSEVPPGLPKLRGDASRLRQALQNAVAAAIGLGPRGPIVLHAALERSGDSAAVRFDVGAPAFALPAEKRARLFEPAAEGPGSRRVRLRLAVARRVVEAMGGAMGIAEPADSGGRLWFTVTVAYAASPPKGRPVETVAQPGTGTVLVVEDSDVNRKVLVAILEHLGYRADAVGNGLEAVEACARASYDAILMDCQMPEMDGFAATAWIRQREGTVRRTPIVALTASVLPGDREKCFAAGMDDYLGKPFGMRALKAMLEKWINRRVDLPLAPETSALPADHPLRVLEAQGRSTVAAEIIDLFLETTPLRLEGLKQVHASGDLAALVSLAHGLKGTALQLGARKMAELCAQIQTAARAADGQEAGKLLTELEAESEQTSHALADERKRLGN